MKIISVSSDVLEKELAGEKVLLDLVGENFFGLDGVATRVWQLLQSGAGKKELIKTLLYEYEVERSTLEKDITDLLQRLAEAGLITVE